MKKVLVIQTAFIGDVILATSLLHALTQQEGVTSVDVLVRKGNESLLHQFPGIRRVLIWDKRKNKTAGLLSVLSSIRRERYDTVINLQRFFSTGLLTILSGASQTIGFDKNPLSFFFSKAISHRTDSGQHETERNLSLIGLSGKTASGRPLLYPSKADFEHVSSFKKQPYTCIAPCSVWYTKQVPAEKWISLIRSLLEGYPSEQILLLGGPADVAACTEIEKTIEHAQITNLAGKLSFLQTAALMKDARMNYVNDSAPMHIASAMNAPVTAFFLSTIPSFGFGPHSDASFIREVDGLSCRPCGLHGYRSCPKGNFRCAIELNMTP